MVILKPSISKQTLVKRRKEQIQHKQNVMLERSRYQKVIQRKKIFQKNKPIQKAKQENLKLQEEKLKQKQILEEEIKQQKIDEYKFYANFTITLFISVTAILIVNREIIGIDVIEKEKLTLSVVKDSGLLEYFSIFILSLSSLVSLVFNTLLSTPVKLNSSLKSYKTPRFIVMLIILVVLSVIMFILFSKLGLAEIFVSLIFIFFTIFLCLVPLIAKILLKQK